jgi:hypothetical protein
MPIDVFGLASIVYLPINDADAFCDSLLLNNSDDVISKNGANFPPST